MESYYISPYVQEVQSHFLGDLAESVDVATTKMMLHLAYSIIYKAVNAWQLFV